MFSVLGSDNYEGENKMEKERILGLIKNEMGSVPLPMENLAELDIRLLGNHLAEKKAAYSTVNALEFKIKNFLNQFDWKPESIIEKDETYTISLLAEVDDGSHKLYVKFAEDSKWIYFSSKFVSVNKNNKFILYEKL